MKKIDEQVRQKLKYIKTSSSDIDISKFPNFLVLGPQRTGTTWLSENLRLHPEVFFTDPKEIYFFNTLNELNNPLHQSDDLDWYLSLFKPNFKEYLKNIVLFQKYQKYSEFCQPKIRGEGTACNATLCREIIEEIVAINPDIKCILTIRNPVMRAWAHAKKDLLNSSNRELEEVSDREFEEFFRHNYQLACGHYTTIINNWTSYLKEGNLLIVFFDEISEAPKELLLRVFDFLEISTNLKYIDRLKIQRKIEATDTKKKERKLPHKYKIILEEIFKEELMNLKQRFDKIPEK